MNNYGMNFQAPRITTTNKIILMVMFGLFLLHSIGGKFLNFTPLSFLALNASDFFHGHLYQILTYPWLQVGLFHFLFDALLFWFLGSELESQWGQRLYLTFLAWASLGGGLLYIGLSPFLGSGMPLYGPLGLTSAMCLGYALVYKDRYLTFMFLFPMKAMHFCLLLIGIQIYMAIFSSQGLTALAHLGAMGGGYLYLNFKSWNVRRKARTRAMPSAKRSRSHLQLVNKDEKPNPEQDDKGGPKYWQ